jgi:hypothetical protein
VDDPASETAVRSTKPLIALVVVFGGLLAYLYFVDAKKPVTPEGTEARDKVFDVEADKIQSLQIVSSTGETTSLVRKDDTWQLTQPIASRADETEVSGITSNLSSLEIQSVVDENPKDLKQYGLAEPKVRVAFRTGANGPERRLVIGTKTPTGGDLYAKRDDEARVFLIPAYVDTTFDRKPFDLRDKTILKFDRDKVDRLELSGAGKKVEAVKTGLDWQLTSPVKARADFSVVEGIVSRLQSAEMKSVVTENPTEADLQKYGLDRPVATATVGAGSSRAALALGQTTPENDVYARDLSAPLVVTVASDLLEDVRKDPADLRRKDIFEFRPFNVSRLEIRRDASTDVFEKTKGADNTDTWRRLSPKAGDVDAARMETLLSKLTALRAQSFVDQPGDRPGVSPALTVAARFDDGKKNEQVAFQRTGEDVLAVRQGEKGAARVTTAEFEEALAALDALQ